MKSFSAKVAANNGNLPSRSVHDKHADIHTFSNGKVPSSDIDSASPNGTPKHGPIFTRASFKTAPHMFHSTHSLEKVLLNDSSTDSDSNDIPENKESVNTFKYGLDNNFILRQSEPNLHIASTSDFDGRSRNQTIEDSNEDFVYDSRL